MKNEKSFIIRLFAITFFIEIIAIGWTVAMPKEWVTPTLPFLPPFFMAVTFMIHKAFMGSFGRNIRQFTTRFMLITTVKLLSLLTIMTAYAFLKPYDSLQFLLSFFILYLFYSIFELIAVLNLNKPQE
jgi:hypothetical protein